MVTIKTPQKYINTPGLVSHIGEYISQYGKNALIIGSKTAYKVLGEEAEQSLHENSVNFQKVIFEGYPTMNLIQKYSKEIKEKKLDIIIGVGGGKVCDLVKAIGNCANIPIVTIPTIVATCASWAARSIIYYEDGDFDHIIWNEYTPVLILVDTAIVSSAPIRYMQAGILDTIAKWYENFPNLSRAPENITLKLAVSTSKLAFDTLKQYGEQAVVDSQKKIISDAVVQTIDAIIYLAGAIGSFAGPEAFGGFAHPFYYATTRMPNTRFRLHGEKVAFGLVVQFILEKQTEKEIRQRMELFDNFQMLFSLKDLGIDENKETDLRRIAKLMLKETPVIVKRGYAKKEEDIIEGIFLTNQKIEEYRLSKQNKGDIL